MTKNPPNNSNNSLEQFLEKFWNEYKSPPVSRSLLDYIDKLNEKGSLWKSAFISTEGKWRIGV